MHISANDLEEIRKHADEAKQRLESLVASVQSLIDGRHDKETDEIIYPSAEMIGAEANQ